MIEINLLPEELKIKNKGRVQETPGPKSPLAQAREQIFIYVLAVILILLISAHVYFLSLFISKSSKLNSLNRKWSGLAAQRKALDEFQGTAGSGQDAGLLGQLNRQRVIIWQKLNALSLQLPPGVWFDEINFSGTSLTIQGSVISLEKEEIQLINKLLENLKTSGQFTKDFSGFELSKVQKRTLGGYDITDFILTGGLKSK
jgi:Tfp pilus assembly protein PilN